MADDQQNKNDMEELLARASFRRFLWRVIQSAGLLHRATDGFGERSLDYFEGRRNLGLEILDMAEEGQPVAHPDKLPLLTLLQVVREETQGPATETKPNGRRNTDRYDRNAELADASADE